MPRLFAILPARHPCLISFIWALVPTATRRRWFPETRSSVSGADVGLTGIYQGRRRMTLTYSVINRARRVLWLVTGAEKVEMLKRLRDADASIPAGRVSSRDALVLADRAAAGQSVAIDAKGGAASHAI